MRALVADSALSAAFVPVFSELLEKGEKARAWRVASTVFWLLLLALWPHRALHAVRPGSSWRRSGCRLAYDDLAVTLSRIPFPIIVLLGVSGVVVGILNSYEQFSIPALTPVFWNLAIIIGLRRACHRRSRRARSSTSTRPRSSSARSSRCCFPCRGC